MAKDQVSSRKDIEAAKALFSGLKDAPSIDADFTQIGRLLKRAGAGYEALGDGKQSAETMENLVRECAATAHMRRGEECLSQAGILLCRDGKEALTSAETDTKDLYLESAHDHFTRAAKHLEARPLARTLAKGKKAQAVRDERTNADNAAKEKSR